MPSSVRSNQAPLSTRSAQALLAPARPPSLLQANSRTQAPASRDQVQLKLNPNRGQIPTALSLQALESPRPHDWGQVQVAERRDNLKALQAQAHTLHNQGKGGIEIWTSLMQSALDHYANRGLSPARQADFAIQDLTLTVVGPDALKHLQEYNKLPWVRHPDPLIQQFLNDWSAMGIRPDDKSWEKQIGWAGPGLDSHHAQDFRPEINDHSDNQIYHTMFYEFMGYLTQDPLDIRAGSIVHELRDGGTSSEDHNAQYVGAATGLRLRALRESNQSQSIQNFPALMRAAYGKAGGPDIRRGQAPAQAWDLYAQINEKLTHKNLAWKTENTVIDGLKWVKQKLGRQ